MWGAFRSAKTPHFFCEKNISKVDFVCTKKLKLLDKQLNEANNALNNWTLFAKVKNLIWI